MPATHVQARTRRRQVGALTLAALGAVALVVAIVAPALAQDPQSELDAAQAELSEAQDHQGVLTTEIDHFSGKIEQLSGEVAVLRNREAMVEAELKETQDRLDVEHDALVALRGRLRRSLNVLSNRLVEIYKSDTPDVVTVVLEADGFRDLLERAEFMQRVSQQDARIIDRVRKAKADAVAAEKHLDALEERQRKVTAEVARRAAEVDAIKDRLVDRQQEIVGARAVKSDSLATTREHRHDLEGDLASLEKEQAAVLAKIQSAQGGGAAGPIRQGSGALIWPVNGPVVSGFGMRWGRLHAGVDIAVPAGTAIRAADSGTVVLLGWTGGYGNYTCIAHGGSLSTCYAHQSSYATSMGARVSKGQVIGRVGCTGHCFGDHLHFETRVNGTPVDPLGYL
jgi:peptidoglycan DL-endopeptidase CwlO